MFEWPIDKWKKLSWARKNSDAESETASWKQKRRMYRKKLIADGIVRVHAIGVRLYSVDVKGMCVAVWSSSGRMSRDVMDAVFDTVMAMERK